MDLSKLGITKAPWEFGDINTEWGFSDCVYSVYSEEKHKDVEMVYMNIEGCLGDQLPNAQLISAAPEMLDRDIIFFNQLEKMVNSKNMSEIEIAACEMIYDMYDLSPTLKATGKTWEEIKELLNE